jgi:hypothetical protein
MVHALELYLQTNPDTAPLYTPLPSHCAQECLRTVILCVISEGLFRQSATHASRLPPTSMAIQMYR